MRADAFIKGIWHTEEEKITPEKVWMSTHSPYDHWIKDRYYLFHKDPMVVKNAFVRIKPSGETAEEKIQKEEKMIQDLFDKATKSYEKTMLEKEKEIMNEKHARMNKFKKGMYVSTPKGRGYIVAFSYSTETIGVAIDGYPEGKLSWWDPMLMEVDYTRVNKVETNHLPAIKNVVFNDPLTVIVWADGTKTYVKASGEDTFDPEKGMALAIAKKAMENKYNYFETIREWIEKDQKRKAKKWEKAQKAEGRIIGKVVEKEATDEGVTAKVVIDGDLEVLKALGIVEPVDKGEEI